MKSNVKSWLSSKCLVKSLTYVEVFIVKGSLCSGQIAIMRWRPVKICNRHSHKKLIIRYDMFNVLY